MGPGRSSSTVPALPITPLRRVHLSPAGARTPGNFEGSSGVVLANPGVFLRWDPTTGTTTTISGVAPITDANSYHVLAAAPDESIVYTQRGYGIRRWTPTGITDLAVPGDPVGDATVANYCGAVGANSAGQALAVFAVAGKDPTNPSSEVHYLTRFEPDGTPIVLLTTGHVGSPWGAVGCSINTDTTFGEDGAASVIVPRVSSGTQHIIEAHPASDPIVLVSTGDTLTGFGTIAHLQNTSVARRDDGTTTAIVADEHSNEALIRTAPNCPASALAQTGDALSNGSTIVEFFASNGSGTADAGPYGVASIVYASDGNRYVIVIPTLPCDTTPPDTTPPTITIDKRQLLAGTLTGTATDSHSSIANVTVTYTGLLGSHTVTATTDCTHITCTWSAPIPNGLLGTLLPWRVTATGTDAAGNTATVTRSI